MTSFLLFFIVIAVFLLPLLSRKTRKPLNTAEPFTIPDVDAPDDEHVPYYFKCKRVHLK